jgi:SAM-dependent methyltransferase
MLSCISCGSDQLIKLFSQYDNNNKITDILLCKNCNALLPNYCDRQPFMTLEQQISDMESALPISKENSEDLVNGYTNVVGFYKDYLGEPSQDRYMCEVGCGRGSLLEALKRKGYKVIGCEPSPVLARKAHDIYQLSDVELINGDAEMLFDAISKKKIPIQCVFMWHVLEHLNQPLKTLKVISQNLITDGLVIFQIPLLQKEQLHLDHLVFYTEPSIHSLALHTGFEVIKVDYDHQLMFCSFVLKKVQV